MSRALRLANRLSSWVQYSSLSHSKALHTVCGARSSQGDVHTRCSSLVGSENGLFPLMPALSCGGWSARNGSPETPDGLVGSMQLMAVPKRKVTPSRKGKRNGPKFLKSAPVVAKCRVCGRIKLPHFYCCDGQVKG